MNLRLLLLSGWLIAHSAAAEPQCYIGTAHSLKGNTTLYTEAYQDNRNASGQLVSTHVRYLTADGSRLADKYLQYGSHPYAPDFTFVNHITGYREQLEWLADGRVRLTHQEQGRPQQMATLSVSEPVVADAGFNVYVQDHLSQLMTGKTQHFHFLNPARLSWYRFSAEGKPLDNGNVKVRIKPDSLLLQWVVDPIVLHYSPSDGRLLQYRGLTNISVEGNHNLHARIRYQYLPVPTSALSQSTIPLQYDRCNFEG